MSRPHKNAAHLIAVGGWVSILYSLFLAYVSAQIGTYCLFCISLYGLNGLILYSALKLVGQTDVPLIGGALAAKSAINIFGGSAAVMLVGTMAWYSGGANTTLPAGGAEEDLSALFHKAEGPLSLDGNEPASGSSSATYTVVEFADYQCVNFLTR